jgi:hypothetical protein
MLVAFIGFVFSAAIESNNGDMPTIPVWHDDSFKINDTLSREFSTFMQYSVAAYCPSTTQDRLWGCGLRCEGATKNTVLDVSVHDSDLQGAGFVGYQSSEKQIIASFRGTSTPQSVIADIDIWQVKADFLPHSIFGGRSIAKVHRGFQNTYAALRDATQTSLNKLSAQFPDYNIVFTGHSLGGAVASMAAVDFFEQNPEQGNRIYVYTFGQPRTGNQAWADYIQSLPFAKNYYRIVQERDPVPHVPLLSMGFTHSGPQYKLSDYITNRCKISGPAGESEECMGPLVKTWFPNHITAYYGWWTYPWFC